MNKDLLFSVTERDCTFDFYRGSGKGGQKRNKTSNCVRCTHNQSGASGKSEEGRSQRKNKEAAFLKMSQTAEFKNWHRIETSRQTGELARINSSVDKDMKKIKVEESVNGKWEEVKEKNHE